MEELLGFIRRHNENPNNIGIHYLKLETMGNHIHQAWRYDKEKPLFEFKDSEELLKHLNL